MKSLTRQSIRLFFLILLVAGLSLQSCRKERYPILSEIDPVLPGNPEASLKGFYLLNEGNMNMNRASLDFLDFTTGNFHRNTYEEANPGITKGLGDVGNDIGIYGSKLYVVVNNSNKIEVLDAQSTRSLGKINLNNGRYLTFHNGKAYVSSYLGKVGDPNAPNGIVVEIDTATLQITRQVEVGRQPEELAVVGEKLYVANSGGYSPPNYEKTVSVIDLLSFKEVKRIEVAENLHRLKADRYGDLYVSARGNYYDIPSRLYVIDTQTERVKKQFDIPASNLAIHGDTAYVYSTEWSYETGQNTINYFMLNIKTENLLTQSFITDETKNKISIPYGIAVNPLTKEVYVTDARDYVSPGMLYCFSPAGKLLWSHQTGDIPAHFAFIFP